MTEFFSNIKDILNGAQFRTVKTNYAQIIEDWKSLVGKKFADNSEVVEFLEKRGKTYMLVYVNSSPLVQELVFFKKNIINKIKEKYNVEISEIIIKANLTSQNKNKSTKETAVVELYSQRPNDEELKQITLDEDVITKIEASVAKQNALSDTQKERMKTIIINDLKTQKWMKDKGFPVCKECGRVMTRKTFGEKNICNICKNNKIREE